MGNSKSKKTTKDTEQSSPQVGVLPNPISKTGTETQLDSMLISALVLPDQNKKTNVTLGLVNTAGEEICRLIEEYKLNIKEEECQLVIVEGNGLQTVMDPELTIEEYLCQLSVSSNIVHLVHTLKPESVPSSLGIKIKNK